MEEITMAFLMNKEQYAKYLMNKIPQKKEMFYKDKRFYRKRICDLTKQLLLNDNPPEVTQDTRMAFENYSKACIHYFKNLDKTDIIQEDYNGLELNISSENNIENGNGNSEEMNKLMMRSIKISEPNALEKMVKRTSTRVISKAIIPIQKEINLKDPILKNKGIRKKNNITNKYDEKVKVIQEKHDDQK